MNLFEIFYKVLKINKNYLETLEMDLFVKLLQCWAII